MIKFPVYVYGDAGAYREYFNAIAAFFGASTFNSILNMAILLSIVTVVFSYSMKRNLFDLVKWLGWFYVAMYISFTPKATVIIIDRVNHSAGYTVDNIPFGVIKTAKDSIPRCASAIGDYAIDLSLYAQRGNLDNIGENLDLVDVFGQVRPSTRGVSIAVGPRDMPQLV